MSITDGRARRIAADWYGGQGSALWSFATTGEIRDLDELTDDIYWQLQQVRLPDSDDRELRELLRYVETAGPRPPPPGWSRLWDDAEVTR